MSVEDAALTYYWMIGIALTDGGDDDWLAVEAASIAYDLAVSVRHLSLLDNVEAVLKRRSLAETVPW